MARTRRYNPFETRSNRLDKFATDKAHWTTVDEGIRLGYRRWKTKSVWLVRRYLGDKRYAQRTLGIADDYQEADGKQILTYFQAQNLAKSSASESEKHEQPLAPRGGHTVREAAESYLESLEAKGRKSIAETRRVLDRDVFPYWKNVPLDEVTSSKLIRWVNRLQKAPRKTRGGKDREIDDSEEGKRKRRATAQRKLSVLRATLNHAVKQRWIDGSEWARFGNIENIDPPEDDFPTTADCKRLIRKAQNDIRSLIEATLLTGAAYRELTTMRVQDYYASTGHVRVFNSKRRPRNIPLTDEGTGLFDELTAGKAADEMIFTHRDGRPWQKSEQKRPVAEANEKAKLIPPITLTRLRKTYGSLLLNAGVPLETVAQAMGHADTRITRKHYARLLQGTIDAQIRDALPSIGGRKKVKRLA